ncbi:MAG: glycosyltransferase [candidate division KSB1 bacterium]|jgi:glycosyltransferase involved in cell wall biosynthesis|nr:glycosyltransferase [candidate division KSB1 bacterium]
MNIAIMGIRGIPANYGGFETFAEELSIRLVEKGHDVTVYGRSNIIEHKDKYYKGVELVVLPTISHKYFDTVAHTALCVMHSLSRKFDVVLICNSANSVFSFIPRLSGKKVALNVDGLEWQRSKWNILGQWFYRISECLATIFPNHIVTDSTFIEKYYRTRFNADSTFIPYGAPTEKAAGDEILKKYNLESGKYILYVSRLEPENNAHIVVDAFERVKTDLTLVVVGDAPYNTQYIQNLKKTRDPRIIFTGYVFGDGYRQFQSNAYCYIQATEVGGTHPALLEAMGYGNCVLANEVPEHLEVLKDAGIYFKKSDADDLQKQLQYLVDHPDIVAEYQKKAVNRIKEAYTWDLITDAYEKLFHRLNRTTNLHSTSR